MFDFDKMPTWQKLALLYFGSQYLQRKPAAQQQAQRAPAPAPAPQRADGTVELVTGQHYRIAARIDFSSPVDLDAQVQDIRAGLARFTRPLGVRDLTVTKGSDLDGPPPLLVRGTFRSQSQVNVLPVGQRVQQPGWQTKDGVPFWLTVLSVEAAGAPPPVLAEARG